MTINDRFQEIMDYYKLDRKSFNTKLEISNSTTIGNIVSGRKSKPSYELIMKVLEKFPEIDARWLLTGDGNIIAEKTSIDANLINEDIIVDYLLEKTDSLMNNIKFATWIENIELKIENKLLKEENIDLKKESAKHA